MSEPVTAASAEVVLAQPRGFCAGVDRAIDIVERALELHGAPIYVRHEIVHNRYVVEDLRAKGAVFIDELEDARGRHRGVLGPRRVTGRARRSRRPWPAGVRRHLPAGDQGAYRGLACAPPAARSS